MRPTETLVLEHQAIQQMLEILVTAAERFQAGELDDPSIFEKAVDFLRGFADRCHHGKEERHLFAKLVEKGVPKNGGPVGVMLMEHEVGRSHIRGMAEAAEKLRAGDKSAEKKLVEHALAYADLLSNHIQKENNILFPLADRILTPEEESELEKTFDQVEAEEMGEGTHEHYHEILEELREQVLASV